MLSAHYGRHDGVAEAPGECRRMKKRVACVKRGDRVLQGEGTARTNLWKRDTDLHGSNTAAAQGVLGRCQGTQLEK